MRKFLVFDGSISLESLDLRLSLSSLLPGGYQEHLVCSEHDLLGEDPLPVPESAPGTNPGTSTPITPPPLPPSGPIGPGTS